MILRSHGGDIAYRMAEWGIESNIPSPGAGYISSSGEPITTDIVFGLPAAMQAIRQASTTVASLELASFEGEGTAKHRVPNPPCLSPEAFEALEMSEFDWLSDMQAAIEGFSNAFALKVRDAKKQVVALDPIHPSLVQVRRKNGVKVFDIWKEAKTIQGLTSYDILHIRGFSIGPGVAAPSPIQIHRNSLGVALAQDHSMGDHFLNDASPGVILHFGQGVNREQAKAWADDWDARHQGPGKRRKTGVIGAGGEAKSFPISLRDAQFVEGQNFSIEQIARIFNWPAWALDKTEESESQTTTEEKTSQLLVFYLLPRLMRFTAKLKNDPDIFADSAVYPEFMTDGFIRVDAKTRAEVEHFGIQDGTLLRDEQRAEHGRPPLPGGAGKIVPLTPVGATAEAVPSMNGEPPED